MGASVPTLTMKSTVHQLQISLPLGRMALEHNAKPGQYLLQDEGTGNWKIESSGQRASRWARLIASRFWTRGSFQVSAALLAGALIATGFTSLPPFTAGLPFAPPSTNQPIHPQSISIAPSSYGSEPIDLSKLPPPIVEADAKPLEDGASAQRADLSPPPPAQQAPATAQKALAPAPNTAPAAAAKPPVTQSNVSSGKVTPPPSQPAAPLPARLALPMPSPVAAAVVPERKAPAPVAQPKGQAPASPEDSKIAVFNEPALQLAKPTAAQGNTSAPVVQAPAAASGPVVLTAKAGTPAPGAKSSVRMLAVQDPASIVVTNPTTRLPMIVKVGQQLPDGSTLKSVDKAASTAVTSKGEQLVLN